MRRLLFCTATTAFLACVLGNLAAQSAEPLRIRAAVAELSAAHLRPEDRYLAASLPRLLLQELTAIQTHQLSSGERSALASRNLEEQRLAALRAISTAVSARDELLFVDADDVRRERADEAVQAARDQWAALQAAEPRLVTVDQSAPIEWVGAEEELGLLPPVGEDPASYLQQVHSAQDVDLLLFGRLAVVDEYALVDLYVYSAILGTIVHESSTAGVPRDLLSEAPELVDELADLFLGRGHGRVLVQTDQPLAVISVDGVVAGYGNAEVAFAQPGTRLIEVSARGYGRIEEHVELQSGETLALDYELEPVQQESVRITTVPGAASVYLDSVWQGSTPLSLPRPTSQRQVRLEADGYFDSRFRLGPDSPQVISRRLRLANIDWDVEITEKRDSFYRSLGIFVLSVPIPLFLFGSYQAVASAFPAEPGANLPVEEWERFGRRGNVLYWSAFGATFASAGLLVNAVFALLDYVRVSEAPHYL